MISFPCPNGHSLKVKDSLAGRTGRCPKCKVPIAIPSPDVDTDEFDLSGFEDDIPAPTGLDDELAGLTPPPSNIRPPRRKDGSRRRSGDVPAERRSAGAPSSASRPWQIATGILAATTLLFAALWMAGPGEADAPPAAAAAPPGGVAAGDPPGSAETSNRPPSPDSPPPGTASPPSGGPPAAVPVAGGTPRAAAQVAADLLEQGNYVDFIKTTIPMEELAELTGGGMTVETAVANMAAEGDLDQLKELTPFFRRCAAAEPTTTAGVLAVFTVPTEEPQARGEIDLGDADRVYEGNVIGTGRDLGDFFEQTLRALRGSDFEQFITFAFPKPEVIRLQQQDRMAAAVFSYEDRPDAVAAMIRDLEEMSAASPENDGQTARYTLSNGRTVVLQLVENNWRFYDAASEYRRTLPQMVADYEPPPPPTIDIPWAKAGDNWRLQSFKWTRKIR